MQDVWRIMLANHRTPETIVGRLQRHVGRAARRAPPARGAVRRARRRRASKPRCPPSSTTRSRGSGETSPRCPDGTYSGEDCQEDDGFDQRRYWLRVDLTIRGDQHGRRLEPHRSAGSRHDQRAVPRDGLRHVHRIFQVIGGDEPLNAGAVRPIDIIAPPGTLVNVRHPGACVGGQTELQPRIVDLIQGRVFSQVAPERCSAASGGTSGNFLFGGIHPRTGEYYTHYHFEGIGWGGRAETRRERLPDLPARQLPQHARRGLRDAVPVVHTSAIGSTSTPAAPAARAAGSGSRGLLHVEADEIVVSALCDRSSVAPWGLFGGDEGDRLAYLVRTGGSDEFAHVLGGVRDAERHEVLERPAAARRRWSCCARRPAAATARRGSDRRSTSPGTSSEGYVTRERASGRYGVVVRQDGSIDAGGDVPREERAEGGRWPGLNAWSPGTISRSSTAR